MRYLPWLLPGLVAVLPIPGDGSGGPRELYWRPDDPVKFDNRFADPALAATARVAEHALSTLPLTKPGPANRPRAITPADRRVN
ncbi:MAG: hypothetical protein RIQ93_189 [Verrucomicrobiota bacterium]|jgi:hypothetical protein